MDDILFVYPKLPANIEDGEPLNLMSMAAYLRRQGISVRIHDETAPLNSFEDDVRNARYVGITTTTCTYPRVLTLKNRIKQINPDAIVMAGGVHATTTPEQTFRDGFDIVVKNEGEKAITRIVRENLREGIIEEEDVTAEEMYSPARDLINMEYYTATKQRCPYPPALDYVGWNMRLALSLTSRGCPYSCIFCHNVWRKSKVRLAPVEYVMSELAELKERYRVDALMFMDDHLFLNRKRSKELFSRMIDAKFGFVWGGTVRVDALDDDVLELARASGCQRLAIGAESGSDEILKRLNKCTTVEQNYAAIEKCHRHGIKVLSSVVIGNPGETLDDIKATMKFLIDSKTDYGSVCILVPYPGTELWKQCERDGKIPEHPDFSKFHYLKAPIQVSEHLLPAELEKIKRKMLIRFYLQPRQIPAILMKLARNPRSMFSKIREYF